MIILLLSNFDLKHLSKMTIYCPFPGALGVTMGTKKNIYTLLGNLSNMADHKFLPGGKSSRDPSPLPKTTSSLERERDPMQENWSTDQEKAEHKDVGTFPIKKGRKEQKAEDDKRRNGRFDSNYEREDDYREKKIYLERGTFPRMSKNSFDPKMRIITSSEMEDKRDRRPKDYPKRDETESYRDKRNHETRPRTREEGKNKDRWSSDEWRYQGKKFSDDLRDRRGDAGDLREIREKDAPIKREKTRPDMDRMDPRMNYTDRVFERDGYSDKRERPSMREDTKDPRGDSCIDERQPRIDKEREDGDGQMYKNKDREKEEDRPKKSRAYENRRMERSAEKVEERWRGGFREDRKFKERKNGQDGKRSGCHSPGVGRETWRDADEERMHRRRGDSDEERKSSRQRAGKQERGDHRWRDPERNEISHSFQNRSDRDDCRGTRGGVLDIGRMWLDPQRGKNNKEKSIDRERCTRQKEEWSEEKKLQGVRGRDEPRGSGEPDERYSKNYRGTPVGRNEFTRGEPEGASVDGDEESKTTREMDKGGQRRGTQDNWQKNGQTNTPAHSEESDREERGGSDYSQHSRSEEGSEVGWREERYQMPSAEDGSITWSSSGDEIEREFRGPASYVSMEFESPEEREEEEEKPQNCGVSQDDQRGGVDGENSNTESHHVLTDDEAISQENIFITTARRDHQQEISNQYIEGDQSWKKKFTAKEQKELEIQPSFSERRDRETEDGMRSKGGLVGIRKIKRDSKTEKLLKAWKEKNNKPAGEERQKSSAVLRNPGDGSQETLDKNQPIMNQINIEALSEEEVEALRIRMSGAWSTDDPKRHSHPPHLKWATSVVREILGTSEDNAMDEPGSETQKDQSEATKRQEVFAERAVDVPTLRIWTSTQSSDVEGEDNNLSEDFEDDADVVSRSMGDTEMRTMLHPFSRKKRSSKYFKAAQLYQQYSEAAQNIEILRQGRTDVLSICEEAPSSPFPSPQQSRRPLPSLPTVLHPHSLSHHSSFNNYKSLPLPESHGNKRRSSSPRLSISQPGTLWRELPGVRDNNKLEELTENQLRLQEVRFEVVTSEASYCHSLDIVVEHFVKCKPLQDLLGNQDRNWLFSRLLEVRAISHRFLEKLEERVDSDIMHFTVCDIIAHHCKRFRTVYVPYLTNQSYQDATYQRLMTENATFKQLVESIEKSAVCQRLPLRSFLVLPFQRITRLKLLVQNIVKRTNPGTEEAKQAIRAMKLLESIIQQSNDSISQMKSIESLVSLNAKVDFECKTLPLISQSRRWVREGPVIELMDFACKDAERSVYLHLFNDYLLLSLQKEGGRFTVINHVPVNELQVENCRIKLHSLQKNLFRLQMSTTSYLLRTDTQSDKLRWISALKRPHDQVDFSAAQDCEQMLCVKAYMAQQPDELSLEKAEVILVHQDSSDNWVEGTRLSDFQRGWVLKSHLETISNSKVKERNLSDAFKLTTATAATVAD
uniref:Uncharacterized protein n=2 Tax=Oryzias latipes TaxID=8090 RepID=H2M906_ORYLA